MTSKDFWAGRRVLLTGQTGFKGAWLARWLGLLGADVFGFGLPPETQPNLHYLLNLTSHIGDIRNPLAVADAVSQARPSVVIHMAAQALVRRSYRDPAGTVATNVTGTVNLLEALRANEAVMASLAAVLVVASDKVYRNFDDGRSFTEADPLGGHDPYSASKAAMEVLTASWADSFFAAVGVPVATARAGNVVGGDWSEDRLVPDLWRAVRLGKTTELRNPGASRPWQWVLDPLAGYLDYIEALAGPCGSALPRALNFGPAADSSLTVAEAASIVLAGLGAAPVWTCASGPQPVEAHTLALDASLARRTLGWRPRLTSSEALNWSVEWYRAVGEGAHPDRMTTQQIERYEALP